MNFQQAFLLCLALVLTGCATPSPSKTTQRPLEQITVPDASFHEATTPEVVAYMTAMARHAGFQAHFPDDLPWRTISMSEKHISMFSLFETLGAKLDLAMKVHGQALVFMTVDHPPR